MAPKGGSAKKASADAAVRAAGGPRAALRLRSADSDATTGAVARILRAVSPPLADVPEGEPNSDWLAASFVFEAEERALVKLPQWCDALSRVLEESGAQLDEDDPAGAVSSAVEAFIREGLFEITELWEEGEMVLAELPDDGDWHPALIDEVLGQGKLRLVFVEFGKPHTAIAKDVRAMEDVVDEDAGNDQEGDCELCGRNKFLTFHHLIPKDTHSRYVGKRLPAGIDGEPTNYFLNSYGTMICRQCHNTVHRAESNDVLAAEFNTVEKLLAHPIVKGFVDWASKQKVTRNARCR